jgi:hypothetical protein
MSAMIITDSADWTVLLPKLEERFKVISTAAQSHIESHQGMTQQGDYIAGYPDTMLPTFPVKLRQILEGKEKSKNERKKTLIKITESLATLLAVLQFNVIQVEKLTGYMNGSYWVSPQTDRRYKSIFTRYIQSFLHDLKSVGVNLNPLAKHFHLMAAKVEAFSKKKKYDNW